MDIRLRVLRSTRVISLDSGQRRLLVWRHCTLVNNNLSYLGYNVEIKEINFICPSCESDEFVGFVRPSDPSDESWSAFSEYLNSTANEETKFEYELSQEVEIYTQCTRCKNYSKHALRSERLAPCMIPGREDEFSLPSLSLRFDPYDCLPITIFFKNYPDFQLKVRECEAIEIDTKRHKETFEQSFGLPFGSYLLSVNFPDLPQMEAKSFKCRISAAPVVILKTGEIKLDYDWSKMEFSITWIDAVGYRGLSKIYSLMENRDQSEKVQKLFELLTKFKNDEDAVFREYMALFADDSKYDDWAISRNTAAYKILHVVENKLRMFLWDKCQEAYKKQNPSSPLTSKWWKACFPKVVIDVIEDNQKKANRTPVKPQSDFPLLYCNFTDLEKIIEKFWEFLFEDKTVDKRIVEGHLAYLEFVRNAVAHNRPLTNEEVAVLHDNTASLSKILGIRLNDSEKP